MFGCREYKDTDRVYSYIIYNFVDCCNSLFPVLASFRHIMQVDLVWLTTPLEQKDDQDCTSLCVCQLCYLQFSISSSSFDQNASSARGQ